MDPLPATESELQEQVIRLAQEKRELQDYAERVTKELRRYQQARPTPPAGPEDDLPLPPWATNMQMMSPLLFSYEERIAELEMVIERSVSLAEQAQILTKENDSLRVELQERTEQLRNAQLLAPATAPTKEGLSGDEQEELRELYRLSVEQNEALAQQNQLLKLQLEKMQQSLVTGQQQAREVHARAVDGAKAYAAEQERAEVLARQKGSAELRLEEVTGELVEATRTREDFQLKVHSLEHELQVASQSLESAKRSFADRAALASDEEERLRSDLSRVSSSDREHRQKAAGLQRELAEVSEQLYTARRERDATKQEADQMLRLMESMERKLRDISERHEEVQGKLQEEERQVADLLLEKDYWTSSEQASKRQLERLETRLQGELETAKQQREQEMSSLQANEVRLVSDLEDRLRRSEQSVAELQSKAEAAERQRAWEASAAERQLSLHRVEKERLQGDLEELQQARLRSERQADSSQQELARVRAAMDASAAELRESAARATQELAGASSRCVDLERRLAQACDDVQGHEARAASSGADCQRLQSELLEERGRSSDQLETERRKAQAHARGLERQLHALQTKAQQDEQRALELLRAQEDLRLRWKTELGHEKEALQLQVERLQKDNRRMREKFASMQQAIAARRPQV